MCTHANSLIKCVLFMCILHMCKMHNMQIAYKQPVYKLRAIICHALCAKCVHYAHMQ